MLPTSNRPDLTEEQLIASNLAAQASFRKAEKEIANSMNKTKRGSIRNYIINALAALVEPIVLRAIQRLNEKKYQELEKLSKEVAEAWTKTPDSVKKYYEEYKMKNLGKTINNLALWRSDKEQAKKGKNPKAKPVTRLSRNEMDPMPVRTKTNKDKF